MNTYKLYNNTGLCYQCNNKKIAIKQAKYIALKLKRTITIYKNNTYIGIAEFPNYLRELPSEILDTKDITINITL